MRENETDDKNSDITDDDNPHVGHRRRMIEKMEKGFLLPHEILEVLLYFVYPRTNTNPIAHNLLEKFKTLENVFRAPKSKLMQVADIGENTAEFINLIGGCVNCAQFGGNLLELKCPHDVYLFMRIRFEEVPSNRFEVYCLSKEGKVLRILSSDAQPQNLPDIDFNELVKTSITFDVSKVYITRYIDREISKDDELDRLVIARAMIICKVNDIEFADYLICSPKNIFISSETSLFDEVGESIKSFLQSDI